MTMKNLPALFVGLAIATSAVAQMTAEEAFSAGKSAGGESAQKAIKDGLTDAKGSELLQGYDPTGGAAGAPAYEGGALTILQGAGVTKTDECGAGNAGSTDPRAAQHCAAVNTVMQQANTPPTTLVTIDDPLVTKSQGVIQDPETYAGKFTGVTTECAELQVTTPGETREETCEDYSRKAGEASCTTTQGFVIDPNYFYKCLETVQSAANTSCVVGQKTVINTETRYQCQVAKVDPTTHGCAVKHVPKVDYEDVMTCVPGTTYDHVMLTGDGVWGTPSYNGGRVGSGWTVSGYCDGSGVPTVAVTGGGLDNVNWKKACGKTRSTRLVRMDDSGFGVYDTLKSTNENDYIRLDDIYGGNKLCWLYITVKVTGLGCDSNDICSAEIEYGNSAYSWSTAYSSMTLSYHRPRKRIYHYSKTTTNECGLYEVGQ